MVQTTLDSFILSDVCQHIELSRLQKMTNEEATCVVEDEKIELITSTRITTGYWHVKKCHKKFYVVVTPQYGITKEVYGFRSKVAAAIYVSQKVGDPTVCRAIAQNFSDDSEAQILTNLRIPPSIRSGNKSTSQWCDKSKTLLYGTIRNTKIRNSRGREHDEVEWNRNVYEFRKFMADELEKLGFRCYLGGLKLTPENISIERLDESKGYSSANCTFIYKQFQVGHCQWSREKVQSVHYLRKKEVEMDFGLEFFKRLEKSVAGCDRRTIERSHSPSEVTVEKLIHEYVKQDGRCKYLTVPLMSEGEWKMSVERLDESKGYIEGNWVLVVLGTQSPHMQWTKEFVEKVWGPSSHPNPQLSVSEEVLLDKYHKYKNRNAFVISARNISPWRRGSTVHFIKSDGMWGIKVPINGRHKSFGQCKTSDIGWKLVDYIRDNSIETKQNLLDSLKSNGLVEYLDEYLPKIRRVGRVRKMGNTYQAILRGEFLGSFKTKQEAEDAIRRADQHPPYSTSSP